MCIIFIYIYKYFIFTESDHISCISAEQDDLIGFNVCRKRPVFIQYSTVLHSKGRRQDTEVLLISNG